MVELPPATLEKYMNESRREGRESRVKYKERLMTIEKHKKQSLQKKQEERDQKREEEQDL